MLPPLPSCVTVRECDLQLLVQPEWEHADGVATSYLQLPRRILRPERCATLRLRARHTADALAVVAWTVGAGFGLLTVNTELYVGPLAEIAGGVDLSTVGSAALAVLIYLASMRYIKA